MASKVYTWGPVMAGYEKPSLIIKDSNIREEVKKILDMISCDSTEFFTMQKWNFVNYRKLKAACKYLDLKGYKTNNMFMIPDDRILS